MCLQFRCQACDLRDSPYGVDVLMETNSCITAWLPWDSASRTMIFLYVICYKLSSIMNSRFANNC